MRITTFSLLFIFPLISYGKSNQMNVEDIYHFIKTYSDNKLDKNDSYQLNYPKYKKHKLNNNLLRLNYEGFTIWLDCKKRGAIKFRYNVQRDIGRLKRYKKFYQDASIPKECQQLSYKGYGKHYDRGHLVPANHLDHSKKAIRQSNLMTNILPQAANMNRGAWLMTEEITECYRDIDELLIIGGVIWGNNPNDDYFVKSHGVKTPDAFWKVIIRGVGSNQRAIAWIVPNSQKAKRKMLNSYQVPVSEIERVTGEIIPVANYAKYDKSNPWLIPRGCDKG